MAKNEGKPFNFTHFILISKLHEATRKEAEGKKKKVKGANILWVNAEEEAVSEVSFSLPTFRLTGVILNFFASLVLVGRNSRRIFCPQ